MDLQLKIPLLLLFEKLGVKMQYFRSLYVGIFSHMLGIYLVIFQISPIKFQHKCIQVRHQRDHFDTFYFTSLTNIIDYYKILSIQIIYYLKIKKIEYKSHKNIYIAIKYDVIVKYEINNKIYIDLDNNHFYIFIII